jgi:hypothetical protein
MTGHGCTAEFRTFTFLLSFFFCGSPRLEHLRRNRSKGQRIAAANHQDSP